MSERSEPILDGEASTKAEPVTVVVTRAVRAGREADYEAWLRRLLDDVRQEFPGYLGSELRRPPAGSTEYTSVFRFDGLDSLADFEGSAMRQRHLREAADLVESDAVWDRYTGLEFWFEPPPGVLIPQPSRFRMALLLTLVVYSLVLGIGSFATWLLGDLLPTQLRLLVVIAVEVALMTYLIMPYLTRRLARWIYPTSKEVAP